MKYLVYNWDYDIDFSTMRLFDTLEEAIKLISDEVYVEDIRWSGKGDTFCWVGMGFDTILPFDDTGRPLMDQVIHYERIDPINTNKAGVNYD